MTPHCPPLSSEPRKGFNLPKGIQPLGPLYLEPFLSRKCPSPSVPIQLLRQAQAIVTSSGRPPGPSLEVWPSGTFGADLSSRGGPHLTSVFLPIPAFLHPL